MSNISIQSLWFQLLAPITSATEAEKEWDNIVEHYTQAHRYYHTLRHLEEMYVHLSTYYNATIPIASSLALFYHDFEYNPLRSDNERQSALHAERKLKEWQAPQDLIDLVVTMILATKEHNSNLDNTEIAAFLDADMAILGQDCNTYTLYCEQVRKEFKVYPDLLYRKGRKAFLEATLHKSSIFGLPYFYDQFELQARLNLEDEFKKLL